MSQIIKIKVYSPLLKVISQFIIIITLTSCDTIKETFDGTYLGSLKNNERLPGKRISILVQQRSVEPDIAARGHQIILPAPTYNKDWPQTGGYANHAMHHLRVGRTLQKKWSISVGSGTGGGERLMAQPIIAQDRLFTMDAESTINAYNINNGEKIWSTEITPEDEEDDHINGGLAFENDTIYASTGFGQVVALAAKTGKVLWRQEVGIPFRTAPTARGNRIFAITVTNKLFALNGQTGSILWTHSGIEESTNLLGGGSPAVDNGVVVAPYSSGELVALKVQNGQELWTDSLAGGRRSLGTTTLSSIRGRPIIDQNMVFAVSNSGQLTAINLRTGRRIWERNIGGIESPWIAGNYLFLISNNTDLIAVGKQNGQIYWVTALPEWKNPKRHKGKITWTGPVLGSDRLIVAGSNGEAMSVSPYSGKILSKVDMPDGVTISPIIAQDTIMFLSDEAELVTYR
jgi:outer membrane protein assembly factor BamB